uniref:CHAT domain-containing protein n=1 Tax=Candidatus Kentrum sp. LPFa TaxID=2126335 RepID=A0A450XHX8_9GAMM|nr:MAG: CHAT domain-containing protein [Candidatus Kentron sp. LPFa]VFK28876.1 MAG: CHAT domain-containing protein [Candidatus Kentron sp. LPFa]
MRADQEGSFMVLGNTNKRHLVERFTSAETLYHQGEYSESEGLAKSIWQQPESVVSPPLIWRAVILDARTVFQRGLPFKSNDRTSPIARLGAAFRLSLDDETREEALQPLQAIAREYPRDPLIQAMALSVESELRQDRREAVGNQLQRLAREHPGISEVWKALFEHYNRMGNFPAAAKAAEKMLTAEIADGRSPLRVFEDRVRVLGAKLQTDRAMEAERQLAAMLNNTEHGTPLGRARVQLLLGIRAFGNAASLDSSNRDQRMHSMEVARHFWEAAVDEVAPLTNQSAKELREIVENFLVSHFDFSGEYPAYASQRPDDNEKDPKKWLDYALSVAFDGNDRTVIDATLHAYALALDDKNNEADAEVAVTALYRLLPKYVELLGPKRVERLFQDWVRRFGHLHEAAENTAAELRRRRVAVLRLLVDGRHEAAVSMLAEFLIDRANEDRELAVDPHRDALFFLGQLAYRTGLYEIAARAWEASLELVDHPSVQEPIRRMLAMEKVRPFTQAGQKDQFGPRDLQAALANLRTRFDDPDANATQLWSRAVDVNQWLTKATKGQLKELTDADYRLIEGTAERLAQTLGRGTELASFQAGLAKAVARIDLMNMRPEWGKFWGGLVLELQRRAEDGNMDDRLLRYDTEREISRMIGDWRHVARSSAHMALDVLGTGNLDITGYLLEIWEALRNRDQLFEPVLVTALIDEALRQTRRQMALGQSRSRYFRDQYRTYGRLLDFLEQQMGNEKMPPEVIEYLGGVYWDIAENMKDRFLFDREMLQEKVEPEYASVRREMFVALARSVLELYTAASEEMPKFQLLAESANAAIERHSTQREEALAILPPRHPERLDRFSLTDLRAALPADTAVLTVVARPRLQDDHGGVMLVTSKQVRFAQLPVFRYEYDIITPLLESWQKNIGAKEGHSGLGFLYRTLVRSFETDLKSIEHLIVVPSGTFNNVPYAALWDEENERYLIERFRISIMPFGKSLATYLASAPRQPRRLLYAANTDGNPEGWDRGRWETRFGLASTTAEELASLPDLSVSTANEQAMLRDAWPTNFDALVSGDGMQPTENGKSQPLNRASLLQRLPQADIVHLSMHGLDSPPDNPERSLLLLNSNAEQPELLFPGDLEGRNLEGLDLIVLSACLVGRSYSFHPIDRLGDTDRWLYRLGEFSGFPRVLFQQGVGGLIGPVGEVPADVDKQLWAVFYRQLREGLDPSRALAATQRAMLADQKSRHPRNWGLYLLFGGWTAPDE